MPPGDPLSKKIRLVGQSVWLEACFEKKRKTNTVCQVSSTKFALSTVWLFSTSVTSSSRDLEVTRSNPSSDGGSVLVYPLFSSKNVFLSRSIENKHAELQWTAPVIKKRYIRRKLQTIIKIAISRSNIKHFENKMKCDDLSSRISLIKNQPPKSKLLPTMLILRPISIFQQNLK